jgi:hypothetical protein
MFIMVCTSFPAHISIYEPTLLAHSPFLRISKSASATSKSESNHNIFQARIKWMVSIGHELGGPDKAESMLKAKGIGFILKYIDVHYKRPVTYPDTVRPSLPISFFYFPSHPRIFIVLAI